ncbi:hypothetical protein DFH09DRAFT_1231834 [Mycena vulgaris]|nr:hypothetical protein DFH09DRAFT_1231834 [Mycena vulgaris]
MHFLPALRLFRIAFASFPSPLTIVPFYPPPLVNHSILPTSPSSYLPFLPICTRPFLLSSFQVSGHPPSSFPHFSERVYLVRARSAGVRLCTSTRVCAAHPSYRAAARSARVAKIARSAVSMCGGGRRVYGFRCVGGEPQPTHAHADATRRTVVVACMPPHPGKAGTPCCRPAGSASSHRGAEGSVGSSAMRAARVCCGPWSARGR